MSAMKLSRALPFSGLASLVSPSIPLLSLQTSLLPSLCTASSRLVSGSSHYSTWPREPWTCPASVSSLRAHHASYSTQPPAFTYKVSASYSGKKDRLDFEKNLFSHNPRARIRTVVDGQLTRRNRPSSGQDAFFVAQVGDTGSLAFGVVDGVGGWQDSGVDPADFAHSLCDYMAAGANAYPEGLPSGPLHPKDLLQYGYHTVIQDKSIHAGGSTACIGLLEPQGRLEVANLGDSGFVHFGLNAVRYVSPAQTHAFNTPYQLSKIPAKMMQQMRLFGGQSALADLPRDANVTTHDLSHGDVLVFATDGVWDNLSPQDALRIVSRYMLELGAWVQTPDGVQVGAELEKITSKGELVKSDANTLQSLLAMAVTREAKVTGLDKRRNGPFAREVQRYYPGENWAGGKPDDICVVVVIAIKNSKAA